MWLQAVGMGTEWVVCTQSMCVCVGYLFPVAPKVVRRMPSLFAINEVCGVLTG
jgi:phosphatidylserine decarboxylase